MIPLSILLVEDHHDSAWSSAVLLRQDGHLVDVAPDGQTAIDMVECGDYDVLLLDIHLPGCSGWEVARHVRKQGDQQTVIIAASGSGSEDDKRQSAAAGMNYHLTKPVSPERLLSVLADVQASLQPDR